MDTYKTKYLEKLKGSQPGRLVICGMGGSGLPGEMLKTFAPELGIRAEITVWKDYGVPTETQNTKHKAQNTLYTFVSFSGETEETINGLKAAVRIKGSRILVITGGGELMKLAASKRLPLVTFDKGDLVPREAAVTMFVLLADALNKIGFARKIPALPQRKADKRAADIVRFVDKGVPLIYTSHQLKSLAYIWKIWLNEAAKTPAFANELPELDHNEIVGFEQRDPLFRAIFITDKEDSERIKTRIALTVKLIKKLGGRAEVIELRGRDKFERFFNGVYMAGDLAVRLAIRNKVDPKRTKSIDTLKAWLKKR